MRKAEVASQGRNLVKSQSLCGRHWTVLLLIILYYNNCVKGMHMACMNCMNISISGAVTWEKLWVSARWRSNINTSYTVYKKWSVHRLHLSHKTLIYWLTVDHYYSIQSIGTPSPYPAQMCCLLIRDKSILMCIWMMSVKRHCLTMLFVSVYYI